jgi:hypothetical protein
MLHTVSRLGAIFGVSILEDKDLQDFVNFKKERAKESAKRREPASTKVSLF